MTRALVYGLAVAGASTVRALTRRDHDVVAADDTVTPERQALADELSVELLEAPRGPALDDLVASCDLVSPAPGIPEDHDVITAARRAGVEVLSEIELAYRWEQQRPGGPRPMLAVTGTDGKTTTTLLAVEMLRAAGLRTVDAGNTSTPLVDAIADDLDAFVVECTSFRLAWTPSFRAEAAAWLNFAPDHLDWHRSLSSYEAAKAQVFANQRGSDVAIGFVEDPIVMRHLTAAPGRRRTFGHTGADYRVEGDGDRAVLAGPDGTIAPVSAMWRGLPHDRTNALAAAALVLESGLGDAAAIERALSTFRGPAHRLEHVATADGIDWFDDSKATTPHAAAVALRAFPSVVLIAGGYDKGVDLAPMAAQTDTIRAVVALGATASKVADVFAAVPVEIVDALPAAVAAAARLARPGDTVLLSPGCASLDQYRNFEVRGDHFQELVRELHAARTITGGTP